jgi:4-diphosphocytidyl-2-C-methyl-D-erythritol kinase
MRYVVTPKINIGLYVLGKRPDGYHEIQTLFYPIDTPADELIIEKLPGAGSGCYLQVSGLDIPGNASENICLKAYHLLAQHYTLPSIHIRLNKQIPTGSGLGGGSADAAATLLAINELAGLSLSIETLAGWGAKLGADVPFFLYNRPMLAGGTGTTLEPYPLDLSNYQIVVYPQPEIHSDTVLAYRRLAWDKIPPAYTRNLAADLRLPIEVWKHRIFNDFEYEVFDRFPKLRIRKQELYQQGALYASMTGSGSALYAIFEK